MFRVAACLSLLFLGLRVAPAAEQEFVIHPHDIADVSILLFGGMVVVSFTPEKAKEFARLQKNSQTVHVHLLIPHNGLTMATFSSNSMQFGFRDTQDAIHFYNACPQGKKR